MTNSNIDRWTVKKVPSGSVRNIATNYVVSLYLESFPR